MADTNTPIISDDLATQVAIAIKWAQADIANQQALMGGDENADVTLTFPDGTTYSGPSFRKIMKLAGNSDFDVLGPLGAQIKQYADQAAASEVKAAASETAAATSETNAGNSATAAATSETNAKDSENAAAASAKAASDSAAAAHLSESNAGISASLAASSLGSAQKAYSDAADAAKAAAGSATSASDSATAASTSESNASASEIAANASSAAAQAAKTGAESARDDAQVALTAANGAKTDAQQAVSDATDQVVLAKQHADRAKQEADKLDNANAIGALIDIVDSTDNTITEQIVNFHNTPTVKGVPISGALAEGGFHVNTDQMCTVTDNLNDAKWEGKNFMVQKGNVIANGTSNNTPAGMEYTQALAMDIYSGWTPANGTKGDQRIQIIYDKNVNWLRGFHPEDGKWTTWKRIAAQVLEEVSNMDLNTVKATGRYSYTRAINAPVIDSPEASTVYFLEVLSADNGNEILQRITSPRTDSTFTRYLISGVWSRWWNSTATFDVDTAPAGVDLNTLTNPGYWGIPLDTAINLPTRLPPNAKVGQAILTVYGLSNGGTIQRLNYLDTGEAFSRLKPSDVSGAAQAWKPWTAEAKLAGDGFLPVAIGGTGAGTADAARAKLNAASLGANSFTGDQTINGNMNFPNSSVITAKNFIFPCETGNARIRMGSYSGTNLDARFEIYAQNMADNTKRSNLLTIDLVDSNVPATGTTNSVNGLVTIAGKLTVSNTSTLNNTIVMDGTPAGNYDSTHLNTTPAAETKNYLRKFRGGAPDTIWHETIQGNLYRLACGSTDTAETFAISRNGNVGGELFFNGYTLRLAGPNSNTAQTGFLIRNDGGNTYFMLTAPGLQYPLGGTQSNVQYNGLRPMTISNSTGLVSMGNGLNVTSGAIQSTSPSNFAWSDQYNIGTNSTAEGTVPSKAAFYEEFSTSNPSEFHPLIKQRFHSANPLVHGSWAQGTIVSNTGASQCSWCICFTPNGKAPVNKQWYFNRDGSTNLPGNLSCATISAGTITGGGTITGANLASNGTLTVATDATIRRNLTVSGTTISGGKITINSGGLQVAGGATIASGLNVSSGDINAAAGLVKSKGATLTSDINEKTNLIKMDNALDKIDGITGYLWDWKDGNGSSAGVIAQDVEKVQTGLVIDDPELNHKLLNYSGVVGLLVNAVKELKADNAELRARLEALEKTN